jgi:electron transfer flavoprotein beta subunit
MNIVVCVKHVPDATAERTFSDSAATVDRVGVDGLLSELDENAVEEALKIAEAQGESGGEVTVLTVGPEQAQDAVRKGLQMGAHRGAHVVDEAIHGSDAVATSLVLAKALQKLREESEASEGSAWDVVMCGMASTDGSMSVVPAMLAERLGLPQVTMASEVSVEASTVRIRRDGDAATEAIEAEAPLVLSVTDQANEPRYPSFKGIMAAKKKPMTTWSLADLGVEASEVGLDAAWSRVDSFAARPPRQAGTVVADEDGDGADKLVEFLAGGKFI